MSDKTAREEGPESDGGPASDGAIKAMSFEEALAALEQVAGRLDRGDAPLEQSIELYKRGVALREHCRTKLAAAEEQVAKITLSADGSPKGTEPFEA